MTHGLECPAREDRAVRRDRGGRFVPGTAAAKLDCQCVACHCGDRYERGWMGSCARCFRPLLRDGRVVR
jgi:hypothetical protein